MKGGIWTLWDSWKPSCVLSVELEVLEASIEGQEILGRGTAREGVAQLVPAKRGCSHPEVDRIWAILKEHMRVNSKIIFYLINSRMAVGVRTYTWTAKVCKQMDLVWLFERFWAGLGHYLTVWGPRVQLTSLGGRNPRIYRLPATHEATTASFCVSSRYIKISRGGPNNPTPVMVA